MTTCGTADYWGVYAEKTFEKDFRIVLSIVASGGS
jgi:hypothetical protein